MYNMERSVVVTFSSNSHAMAMERYCRLGGITGRLIPAPRQVSRGCGLAWASPIRAKEGLLSLIRQYNLSHKDIVELYV